MRITAEAILVDGQELDGTSDERQREILIAAFVPPAQRLDVLLHELRHCWLNHFAKPRTEEEDCNFTAATTASALADLDAQGGVAALMRLKPVELPVCQPLSTPSAPLEATGKHVVPPAQVEDWETLAAAHAGRAQCGVCETIIACGSIVNSPPRWDTIRCGSVLDRTLYCPHCHHLQLWIEGCGTTGEPNGAIAAGPTYVKGRAVDEFLEANPCAVGLIAG